jgi:hypothetical protein
MKHSLHHLFTLVAVAVIAATLSAQAFADPLPGRDLLKFSQRPMIATSITNTTGTVNTYMGHDELSTGYGFSTAANPNITTYEGKFMADDFADNLSSPVVHVKWWGSYHNDVINPNFPVNKFLIAFESDVPANQNPAGYSQPGQVLMTDVVSRSVSLAPGSGQFTEKLIRGPDPLFNESLYEYNAELHFNNNFPEKKDTVYWLKIVGLVDVPGVQSFPAPFTPYNPPPNMTQWGWHNRDYTIQDALASPNVAPGETSQINPADGATVWHFQDDAVQGDLRFLINAPVGTPNLGVFQSNMLPTLYIGGADGAGSNAVAVGIDKFSKDLAFELYTTVPEPASCVLLSSALLGLALQCRRQRS